MTMSDTKQIARRGLDGVVETAPDFATLEGRNRWRDLEPEVRRIFEVDDFGVDGIRRKMVIETWGTVRLDMLAELAKLTGSDAIEVIAIDRAALKRGDGELPNIDVFPNGLLIQVFAP